MTPLQSGHWPSETGIGTRVQSLFATKIMSQHFQVASIMKMGEDGIEYGDKLSILHFIFWLQWMFSVFFDGEESWRFQWSHDVLRSRIVQQSTYICMLFKSHNGLSD